MSITNALRTSLTGLKVNQRELEVVSNNIANADSVGYTRKTLTTSAIVADERTIGVRVTAINREVDLQVQKQWRSSAAAGEYARIRSDAMTRLDSFYGGPANVSSLDQLFSEFTGAMETLATSPEDNAARIEAVAAADSLAASLRTLSANIQALRGETESSLADAVDEANSLLALIADLDKQVVAAQSSSAPVGLLDQRDAAIDSLSKLMDIRVEEDKFGKVTIHTTSGQQLYGATVSRLGFDEHGVVNANSQWTDSAETRTLGTVTLDTGDGMKVDLFAAGAFRSGSIAAYRSLRDDALVTAQAQIDELASVMARAISNTTVAGEAASAGGAEGFDLDVSGLATGNTISLAYKDAAGVDRRVTFVATNGGASPGNGFTADPKDTVVAVDTRGGSAALAAAIQQTLGAGFQVTSPSDGSIRVLDDGAGGSTDVTALSASVTLTELQSGEPQFALFVDGRAGGQAFTGYSLGADQTRGFAERIMVNPALTADSALMVKYAETTTSADATRPRALLDALTSTTAMFNPATGVGTTSAPYTGTVKNFLTQVLSTQGAQIASAQRINEGQSIVTANLEERYRDSQAVNIDEEMARLIELQTAYQANARVMKAAQDMIDALFGI
ncbi:flagellar hook-associated protein FlgK [Methylobrevis albus]|uniref:Flagellar hook-associated protein 1 n=1 Tax=Methylobrevis albus TaxID=2793297 RepID=A0A931MXG8_9HYPH|nr:flagellar hook-associated protein FlgK [Methylobrevis albus]MBH0236845.1 flagellar hook-associated protein FlgK [Methylobrevis albus]